LALSDRLAFFQLKTAQLTCPYDDGAASKSYFEGDRSLCVQDCPDKAFHITRW
jgi:hypothetical protein